MSIIATLKGIFNAESAKGAMQNTPDVVADLARQVISSGKTRIVIYGAGEMGEMLLELLSTSSQVEVLLIVDMKANYREISVAGNQVSPPSTMKHVNFDALVIASKAYGTEILNYVKNKALIDSNVLVIAPHTQN